MAFAMTSSYALGARATTVAPRSVNARALVLAPRRSIRVLATQDPIDQASEKVEEVWALRSLCDLCGSSWLARTSGSCPLHFDSEKGTGGPTAVPLA